MRLAAIDIGSNSIHLVVGEADGTGAFRVVTADKEMVRLGDRLAERRLSPRATERALSTLRRQAALAAAHGAADVRAVATSAVREAANGGEFLARVRAEVGIRARAISGHEEARLVYLAVRHSVHLSPGPMLVVDIGGGSVELAAGGGEAPAWTASEPLGVLRLTRAFARTDPLSPDGQGRLDAHIEERLRPHARRVRAEGIRQVVATSGTALCLGALAAGLERERRPEGLHHLTVRAASLHAVRRFLAGTDVQTRRALPGIGARADIIVAGAAVLSALLRLLGDPDVVLCEWALREGVLLEHLRLHPRAAARPTAWPDVRRRSVMALAARCRHDGAHAAHVASLALALFDQTRVVHGLGARERALLECGAVLHDVGQHVSYADHHKHARYLIKHGGLRGFDPDEIEMLACVARYHRGRRPRRRHAGYGSLPRAARRAVKVLVACVRLADALDRGHRQRVGGLQLLRSRARWRIVCRTTAGADLELWAAAAARGPLERVLGAAVVVEAEPATVPLANAAGQ